MGVGGCSEYAMQCGRFVQNCSQPGTLRVMHVKRNAPLICSKVALVAINEYLALLMLRATLRCSSSKSFGFAAKHLLEIRPKPSTRHIGHILLADIS